MPRMWTISKDVKRIMHDYFVLPCITDDTSFPSSVSLQYNTKVGKQFHCFCNFFKVISVKRSDANGLKIGCSALCSIFSFMFRAPLFDVRAILPHVGLAATSSTSILAVKCTFLFCRRRWNWEETGGSGSVGD